MTLSQPDPASPNAARTDRASRADAEPLLVRQIVQEAARRDGSAAALCRGLGFAPADLEKPDFRISYTQTQRVVQRALPVLGRGDLGVTLGSRFSVVSWGLVLIGMMASGTPREMLEFAVDFLPSTDRFLRLRHDSGPDEFIALAEPEFDDDEVGDVLVQFAFAALARAARFVVGSGFGPKFVELRAARPADVRPYEQAFGCPVRFGAAANRVGFELVEQPIATADAAVARLLRHALSLRRSGDAAPSEMEAAIVRALRINLQSPPSMSSIAATLNLSERTLRRRLDENGLSYAALLDGERMRRALELLNKSELTLPQVAQESGFADVRSLRRAIKRWTGHTPSAIRQRDAAAAARGEPAEGEREAALAGGEGDDEAGPAPDPEAAPEDRGPRGDGEGDPDPNAG